MTDVEEIRTERLLLRPIARKDLDAFAAMFADPEVVRFIGDGTVATPDESAEWIEVSIDRNEAQGWDMRSVLLAEGDAAIGRCGIAVRAIEGRTEREVAYLFAREHWGKGYATEAATAVRDRALGELGLSRLIALIDHGNEASKGVARKLGMSYERDVEFHGRTVELHALEG
ncbi:MAG TPA: GNAT family N-acetyltransferase [Actinomycetota bacterium]|nr:GNAT family N-acetyltransferase [Actinomycetota bacterium]